MFYKAEIKGVGQAGRLSQDSGEEFASGLLPVVCNTQFVALVNLRFMFPG